MFLSENLSEFFPEMSFVGFYDAKVGDNQKIYIGEYFSNDEIFPCGEIKYGHGQCGLCAKLKKVMIAVDTKLLTNYIPCDANTRSEIVLPVLNKDGSFRTQLDIDSPHIGTFTVDRSTAGTFRKIPKGLNDDRRQTFQASTSRLLNCTTQLRLRHLEQLAVHWGPLSLSILSISCDNEGLCRVYL